MKRLNDGLEFTLTSSLTPKRNMKNLSFLQKSPPVQACRPLYAKFYKTFKHFENQRRTDLATMHGKNSGSRTPNIQDLPKKRNPTSIQQNFLFSCSEDDKLGYQRQLFCQFEADGNKSKCGGYQLFHLLNDPCLQWKTFYRC